MFCTKCGAKMAEGQRFCSNCGAPAEQLPPAEPKTEPVIAPPEEQNFRAPEPSFNPPESASPPPKAPEKPKKKGKAKGWILGILAVLVLAAAVLAVFRWNAVSAAAANLYAKTFSEPEEYYQRVEKNNVEKYLDAAESGSGPLAFYQESAANRAEKKNAFMEEKVQFSFGQEALSDEILDLLEREIGMDISWFKNLGLYISFGMEEETMGGSVTAFLNDTDIIDADYALDNANQLLYLTVPKLSGQYMKIDLQEAMEQAGSGSGMSRAAAEELTKLLADGDLIRTLVERYSEIVINDLTKVDKGTQKITAGDLSETFTVLEVKIDGKVMLKIAKDVLKKAQNDAEIEKLLLAVFKSSGMDDATAAQYFDQFLEELAQAQEKAENTDPDDIDENILMTVYVDGQGRVRGRDIKYREDKDLVSEFSYALVLKGLNYGVRAEFFMDESRGSYLDEKTVVLDGGGKISLSKEITGSFDMRYKTHYGPEGDEVKNDMKLCKITLEAASEDKGFRFDVGVTPHKDMLNRLVEKIGAMPDSVEDLIRSLSGTCSGEVQNSGSSSLKMVLKSNKKDLAAISADAYLVEDFDIRVPTETVAPEEWVYGIDYSKLQELLGKLKEAGVPASILGDIGYYL